MKIAQIAPFEEAVPPKKYGGTERIVFYLTEELVRRGHKVTLFATGDSKTSAKLFPVFPKALRASKTNLDLKNRESYKFLGVVKIVTALKNKNFDIVHNHIGWRIIPFAPLIKSPLLTTLHGPLDIDYQRAIFKKFPRLPYVSISKSQRKPLPEINFVGNVYNGIDLKTFQFNEKPKNYLAFLGRMSPEKGPVEAIKVAKMAKMKLIMAAKVDVVDREFFSKKVKPLIDGKQIKFIGEVGHKQKNKLLKEAKALVSPIKWREPFGLFLTEAMACGTPVIAFRRGSIPEIIEDGKTGFIVNNVNEMAKAIQKIDRINRRECRKRVEENFSLEKMVDNYEKIYYQVIK